MRYRKHFSLVASLFLILLIASSVFPQTYPIVGTNQVEFYDTVMVIPAVNPGEPYYGQNANYPGIQPSYSDNGDGTVTDNITGLMWQKSPDTDGDGDIDYDDKMSYDEAMAEASIFNLAGYNDWRLPTIKELYSLIIFSGVDPSGYSGGSTAGLVPFIDTNYFDFNYGDQGAGERIIDAQYASQNLYVALGGIGGNQEIMFGVNFADGRIKGYETGPMPGQTEDKQFYVIYVRGSMDYGINDFSDNGDGTITDISTGLMWMQDDNGQAISWADALNYAETFSFAGYDDWRLPDVKELQSIVDYTRAPSVTNSAAIDPLFNCTQITDEGGNVNFPFYWSSTTHASWVSSAEGASAAYVAFGEALGWIEVPPGSGNYSLTDVHGAGAQRSDPKFGDPNDYPYGHGPQGDVIRIFNYVRLVRDVCTNSMNENNFDDQINIYPNPFEDVLNVDLVDVNSNNTSISIYNTIGQIVHQENFKSVNTFILDTSDLKTGIYFLSLSCGNNFYTKKLFKK